MMSSSSSSTPPRAAAHSCSLSPSIPAALAKGDHSPPISSAEELVDGMRTANESFKGNRLSTVMGAQIFDICSALREKGRELEGTHKADLNKFFATIRQLACRESGELGLPCRLKLMETLELRLMGWRTNLAHANFYAKKEIELDGSTAGQGGNGLAHNSAVPAIAQQPIFSQSQTGKQHCNSATLPGHSPFHFPMPPPSLLNSPDIPKQMPPPAPGFFFIPSTAGTFIPTTAPLGQSVFSVPPPPPSFPYHNPLIPITRMPSSNGISLLPTNLLDGLGIGIGQQQAVKSSRIASQLREEVTIKNSDSGKVMGVKGRRVALIEELSGTVISFQRVLDPKCKERQLTILGDQREAIEHAKRLIAGTIERNVSPDRPPASGPASNNNADCPPSGPADADNANADDEGHPALGGTTTAAAVRVVAPICIEKAADGALRIASSDPSILQTAQEILNEYMRRLSANGSGEGVEAKEEGGKPPLPEFPLVYDRKKMLEIRSESEKDGNLEEEAKRKLTDFGDILLSSGK